MHYITPTADIIVYSFFSFADLFFQSSKDVSFHNTHIELWKLTKALKLFSCFIAFVQTFLSKSAGRLVVLFQVEMHKSGY